MSPVQLELLAAAGPGPGDSPLAVPGFDTAGLCRLLQVPFSAEQLAAITQPLEPYVVVAGAGSGKTTVMTARVVWLVATGQVRPEQVLGLTFTTKAAGELASRVRTALQALTAGQGLARELADEIGEPMVSTYHSFAGRLLAEHGLRLGVEPGSRLLTDAAAHQLAERVVARTRTDLAGYGQVFASVVEALLHLDADLAEHLVEPSDLERHERGLLAELASAAEPRAPVRAVQDIAATAQRRLLLAGLVRELRSAKTKADLVDFGDQMRFSAALAEQHPLVGESLREQYAVVLLDEYQDTSVSQRRLLTALFGSAHPVTAVGDPLQAIYGWRGASVENIDRFGQHFPRRDGSPAAVLPLAENRRSGVRILTAANAVAAPLRALHPQVRPLVAPPGSTRPSGLRVALLERAADEVSWVADRVAELVSPGSDGPAYHPGDIALLCRGSRDFPALLTALSARDIPVQVKGLDGMLSVPEVAEVVSVLDVLHDSGANPALVRLLTGPRWRIGARDLAILGRRARDLASGGRRESGAVLAVALDDAVAGSDPAELICLLDAVDDPGAPVHYPFDPRARERFAAFTAELRGLRRHLGEPLADLVTRVVTTTGLDVELAASPDMRRRHRSEGLAAFTDLVAAFADDSGETSLGAFLRWLKVAQAYDAVPDLDLLGSPDAVQLMTVHRSKGLEWPVVVLPYLSVGVFPGRGRDRWTSQAQVLPYPLRGDVDSLPRLTRPVDKAALTAFVADCKEHDEREERRLAYVAVTRAKTLLLACGSWWGPTQQTSRGPSPFLVTLQQECVAGAGTVDAWAPQPADPQHNPYLHARDPYPWPVVPDAAAAGRRRAVATAVSARRALAGAGGAARAGGAGLPVPAGLDPEQEALVHSWDGDLALLLAELDRDTASERVVPLPASLSASNLVALANDEAGFLRRLARPVPSAPAPAARRGTRFHAWVEEHYGVRPLLEPDDLPGAADAGIDSDPDLAAMRAAFLTGPYADRSPVGIEVAFALVLGARVVPGRIDAVFATRDAAGITSYEVVDWKTSTRQNADPLQLAIYRVAYAELAGVPLEQVSAAFCYVRDGSVVRPDDLPDRAWLERLLA